MTEEMDNIWGTLASSYGSIDVLLDGFFSFLHRKTDFFHVTPSDANSGFRNGQMEKRTLQAFHHYNTLPDAKDERTNGDKKKDNEYSMKKKKIQKDEKEPIVTKEEKDHRPVKKEIQYTTLGKQQPIGNGGKEKGYEWTQSLQDITMTIPLGKKINVKNIKVIWTKDSLKVKLKDPLESSSSYCCLLSGSLFATIRCEDSTWCVEDNMNIVIVLDKIKETWWKNVLLGDEEIDTNMVDSTKQMHEYDENTQGAIRKIMFDRKQQAAEELAVSDDSQTQHLLQQAQQLPGSPFVS